MCYLNFNADPDKDCGVLRDLVTFAQSKKR